MDVQPRSDETFIELRGRYSSFRAAGVAKSRSEGQPISLDRARRSAGGSAVPAAVFGGVGLVALVGWPFALTAAWFARERDSTAWSAYRVGLGVLAVAAWLGLLLALRFAWNHSAFGQRRRAAGLRQRALTRLGEAAADAAGAFDWDEIVLRDGSSEASPAATVMRKAGQRPLPRTTHIDSAWLELVAAIGKHATTVVHVLPNGEIWGGTAPTVAGQDRTHPPH